MLQFAAERLGVATVGNVLKSLNTLGIQRLYRLVSAKAKAEQARGVAIP